MRLLYVFFIALLASNCASSAELNSSDSGVYVVVGRDGQLSSLSYRFTLEKGSWRAEGKEGPGPWINVSCDHGCQYVTSSSAQSESYLPPPMKTGFTIACIQNSAQAFCRYIDKSNPSQGGYVVMGLVTSPPTPIFVRRQR